MAQGQPSSAAAPRTSDTLDLKTRVWKIWGQFKHNKKRSTGAKKTDEIEGQKNRKQRNPKTVLPSYLIDKTQ